MYWNGWLAFCAVRVNFGYILDLFDYQRCILATYVDKRFKHMFSMESCTAMNPEVFLDVLEQIVNKCFQAMQPWSHTSIDTTTVHSYSGRDLDTTKMHRLALWTLVKTVGCTFKSAHSRRASCGLQKCVHCKSIFYFSHVQKAQPLVRKCHLCTKKRYTLWASNYKCSHTGTCRCVRC